MATQAQEVTIRGRFSPGTKVKLVPAGASDTYNGAGNESDAADTATTNRDGETTFKAAPGRYFAVATQKEWNHVLGEHRDQIISADVTINEPTVQTEPHLVPGPEIGPEAPSPSWVGSGNVEIIVGARGSNVLDPGEPTRMVDNVTGHVSTFASPVVGDKIPASERPKDGVPQPRQEDNRNVPLSSSTLTGEAIPPIVQPDKQEDSTKRQAQASDTETGMQVPAREVVRQEDFKGRQASDTQTGVAVPVGHSFARPEEARPAPDAEGARPKSSSPLKETQEAEGRSGAKTSAEKDEAIAAKANKSRQARAARKAEDDDVETVRSPSDATATAIPSEDVRGVEHREVPETIGTPAEDDELT
jgi:hypothetical protein